jgi:hypothetical protein
MRPRCGSRRSTRFAQRRELVAAGRANEPDVSAAAKRTGLRISSSYRGRCGVTSYGPPRRILLLEPLHLPGLSPLHGHLRGSLHISGQLDRRVSARRDEVADDVDGLGGLLEASRCTNKVVESPEAISRGDQDANRAPQSIIKIEYHCSDDTNDRAEVEEVEEIPFSQFNGRCWRPYRRRNR